MRKKWMMLFAVIGVVLIGGVLAGPVMSNVETPKYEIIEKNKPFEIRQYEPQLIAKVEMEGTRKEAIGDGFRQLADFIFGNNQSADKIAMTAPVTQQTSQKIAMTAPVQQQSIDNKWHVSFIMPSEFNLENLPTPNNPNVIIEMEQPKTYVVIRFSGNNDDENVLRHQNKLLAYLNENELSAMGEPKYAFYNPLWTLPALRRNEVMIEIASPS